MSTTYTEFLQEYLQDQLGDKIEQSELRAWGELSINVSPESWLEVANFLRRDEMTRFDQLIDLCVVDYLTYGQAEWDVTTASSSGFSRAVAADDDLFNFDQGVDVDGNSENTSDEKRYRVVVHLLSIKKNTRIRLSTWCEDNGFPVVSSLVGIWSSANWYEREAFDLFGVMFNNHPDLRRILTDYGFVGHPFRKDFPLTGQVEMRYDEEKKRVVYEPVSIELRTLVPKVIRGSGASGGNTISAAEEAGD